MTTRRRSPGPSIQRGLRSNEQVGVEAAVASLDRAPEFMHAVAGVVVWLSQVPTGGQRQARVRWLALQVLGASGGLQAPGDKLAEVLDDLGIAPGQLRAPDADSHVVEAVDDLTVLAYLTADAVPPEARSAAAAVWVRHVLHLLQDAAEQR